jgi:DNA replication protein DnaC
MRYKDAHKDHLPPETIKAIEQCIEEKKGLFFYGGTGTGKTYTLHALARDKGKVENFVDLLVDMRDAMQNGFYKQRLDELTREDHLFIDDIGAEKVSDFVIEFLYLVVNKRYENTKRTVFSTNLSLEEFGSRYGERILSRIAEMCVFHEIAGEDRRL